jgi:hypothetical protein
MAGRDNPYDMQIKLLMIGDSGLMFSHSLIISNSFLTFQVLVKLVYSFVMPMTHFPQHSLQQSELILKLKTFKSMEQESSSRSELDRFHSTSSFDR